MAILGTYLLFVAVFAASIWTLFASVRPQLHRFAELARPVSILPALPPRLSRVTVRAMPARMPIRPSPPQRAVA
ncbi:hypothetical protein [Sphingomonas xinjiangensis]|uniref:Uncharacterized protein n=1 Tax=Sphingomonas xinjiangensis TaxID=643568 RepID=A0A840Y7A3_9SPHN|nr:hypothetical protein [Sphingomonas xinjiangensis]MBB5709177.1 hypothetical protein [Sphingomonas xinjiangensis]